MTVRPAKECAARWPLTAGVIEVWVLYTTAATLFGVGRNNLVWRTRLS